MFRLALSSTGRKRRAAREAATDQIVKGNITVDTLAALEPEDCFQRLFCSAATRRYRLQVIRRNITIASCTRYSDRLSQKYDNFLC